MKRKSKNNSKRKGNRQSKTKSRNRNKKKMNEKRRTKDELETIDSCILAASRPSDTATRTISLLGNPINCDCSLRWLLRLR